MKIINNIIRIILILIHLIFIVYLIKLNILPNIYLGIIIGVILMFDIISCLLISKGKIRPIIGIYNINNYKCFIMYRHILY